MARPDRLSLSPRRIHITGGPGSGKTHLARRLSEALGLPHHELDARLLDMEQIYGDLAKSEATAAAMRVLVASIVSSDRWISDGAYLGWAEPLIEQAELVIWMRTTWHTASYRILSRHAKASLRRTNRFPGLANLYRFWRWSGRYYADRNGPGLNPYGNPATLSTLETGLVRYQEKLVICLSESDIERLLRQLQGID